MMIPQVYDRLTIPQQHRQISVRRKEAEFLYNFLKEKHMSATLEVGLAFGCATAHIISATQTAHYAMDPFQHKFDNIGLKNIEKLGLSEHLRFENDFSHAVLPKLLGSGLKVDFAFLDGSHTFDDTFIELYYTDLLLNPGGFVLFHDAWMQSVQAVCSWLKKNRKKQFERVKTPIRNLVMFQKLEEVGVKNWHEFHGFSTRRSIIIQKLITTMALRKKGGIKNLIRDGIGDAS